MAIVFGGKSDYLGKLRFNFFFVVAVILLLMFVLANIMLRLNSMGMVGLLVTLVALIVLGKLSNSYFSGFARVDVGMRGEKQVARELEKLPDQFAVFRGIKVRDYLDIDCTVVGPTGIFAIEVKGHRGLVGFNGQQLTRNSRLFEKDFLLQAMSEAVGLRELIRSTAKVDVFVEPIIVFSDQYASVKLGPEKIKGCYVIGKAWLNELVERGTTDRLDAKYAVGIARALAGKVEDRHKEEKILQLEKNLDHNPPYPLPERGEGAKIYARQK